MLEPDLTLEALKTHTGPLYFKRGEKYYHSGRVLNITQEPDTITGAVIGSRNRSYTVHIFLEDNEIDSACSCPMNGGCKHVAAVGLAALHSQAEKTAQEDPGRSANNSSGQASTARATDTGISTDTNHDSNWRSLLDTAINPDKPFNLSEEGGFDQEHSPARLELLMRLTPGGQSGLSNNIINFNNPYLSPLPRKRERNQLQLELRPRVFYPDQQKAGVQSRSLTSIQWRILQSYNAQMDINLAGLSYDTGSYFISLGEMLGADRVYPPVRWMPILNDRAKMVFELLRRHSDHRVPLYAGEKNAAPVTVSETPLAAELFIDDDNKNRSYLLRRRFMIEEVEYPETHLMIIGTPPVCAVVADYPLESFNPKKPFPFSLHPVTTVIPPESFSRSVSIPKKERHHLQHSYLPELTRQYAVRSNSRGIQPPEYTQPSLIISIAPSRPGKKSNSSPDSQLSIKVTLTFDYEGRRLKPEHAQNTVGGVRTAKILTDKHAEQTLLEQIRPLMETAVQEVSETGELPSKLTLSHLEAARFMVDTVPRLRKEAGVEIEIDQETPSFSRETAEPDIRFRLEEPASEQTENTIAESDLSNNDSSDHTDTGESPNTANIDWFDLGVTVTIGNEEVPFSDLFTALAAGEDELLLPGGTFFPLNHPSLDQLRELINEAQGISEVTSNGLTISRFQIGFWQELQLLGVVEKQSRQWQETAEGLLSSTGVSRLKPPRNFQATLRDYQKDGYSWLAYLYDLDLGGVLADDMGLGKTIQILALITRNYTKLQSRPAYPTLVVAPTSVVENWKLEAKKFAPDLKCVVMRSGNREDAYEALPNSDLVITSYALLSRDIEKLTSYSFDALILDEAQYVKNYQSRSYHSTRRLNAPRRFALTGTPMENNLTELWSIFSVVAPGLFSAKPQDFKKQYRTPIEKGGPEASRKRMSQLQYRIRPFFMRRTKEMVEKDLPEKTQSIQKIDMNPQHKKLYELFLQRERQKILELLDDGGLNHNRFQILSSLTRLRQMAIAPSLVDTEHHHNIRSSKLEALREIVATLTAENHRVLIFSQFTAFLRMVVEELNDLGISHLYLDGSTSTKKRQERIAAFQNTGDYNAFVISLKAGGVGLNLTAADYCIILDPWWNPAVENQAIDRTHRIGQTKPIMVYRMITRDTIEEKVQALQEKKHAMFQNLTEKGDKLFDTLVTEADIKNLFSTSTE